MNTAPYQKFTNSASAITKSIVSGQAELCEIYAKTTEGTPVSPLLSAAASMHRATLTGFDALSDALHKTAAAQSAETAAQPLKATAKVMKKAVDAQAELLIDVGTSTVKATAKTKDAVTKAAESAAKGDMATLFDDLTVVTGIGPATMKKLQAEGIRTISDLAKTSSKDLSAILEKTNVRISKYTPADWIADAKKLLKSAKAA